MQTYTSISALREQLKTLRQSGKRIALVPTMGNLHAGHVALVTAAKTKADVVVTTIFVNPLQFGPNEDFDRYPRTLEADRSKLEVAGNDILFTPTVADMYPQGMGQSVVHVPGCTEGLCGQKRPGHFDGVSTVVTKFFNMIQPDIALFGNKDFQQLTTIKKMVVDLCFPIEIIGLETVREADGLAMSSRNGYLSAMERQQASKLYETLLFIKKSLETGEKNFEGLVKQGLQRLERAGFLPDYIEIRDALTFAPVDSHSQNLVILAAAFMGKTRLIDNVSVVLNGGGL